jgi:hypothetical protein
VKFEFDVLYGRSSAEVKRELDVLVRDDVELLDETPVPKSAQLQLQVWRQRKKREPKPVVERAVPKTAEERAAWLAGRKRTLEALKLCINGPSHGPATNGTRCAWCALVNNHGLQHALRLAERGEATKPVDYVPRPRRSRWS